MKTSSNAQTPPLLLSAEQAAKLCSISVRQWHTLRASGGVPEPIRLGGCVRWSFEDIKKWVAMGCPALDKFNKYKEM